MKNEFLSLVDPYEKEHAMAIIREWLELPEQHHPESCAKTLQENIIEPLEQWMEKNHGKKKAALDAASIAALYFRDAVQDLIDSYEQNEFLKLGMYVNSVNNTWEEFQKQIAWDNAYSKYQHSEKQSKKRKKRTNWRGLDTADRKKRDAAIIAHYEKTKHRLSISGFAEKHHAKYNLKSRRVREIIKKAVGS